LRWMQETNAPVNLFDISDMMFAFMMMVNVVFIPLPMLTAMKEHNTLNAIKENTPFRCIRIVDRVNKVVSSTTQCI